MKPALFFLFTVFIQPLWAQKQEPLYYFVNKDGKAGVKNAKGRVIIPARHFATTFENGDKVGDGFINLIEEGDTGIVARKGFGKVYDRKGNFLYRPYSFDNGPDRLNEGLTRFVENGKVGFVDRHGRKVIPAKFDFVDAFNLGTAVFCHGCYFDTKKDREHPPLTGGIYGVINRQGIVLIDKIPFEEKRRNRIIDSVGKAQYPKDFQYTSFEKKLISKLEPYKKAIAKEYFSNYADKTTPRSLIFDIVEKPSPGFAYYIIQSREKTNNDIYASSWDNLTFYVASDGKKLYAKPYDEKLIPFLKWYAIYIKGGRDFDQ